VLVFRLRIPLDRFSIHPADELGEVLGVVTANPKDDFGLHVGQRSQHPGGKLGQVLVGHRHTHPELASLGKDVGQGFDRALVGHVTGKLVNGQVPQSVVPPPSHRQLQAGDHQAPNQPVGLTIRVPQVQKQDLALVHDRPEVQVVGLLAQHQLEPGVEAEGADLVQRTLPQQRRLPTPLIVAVVEELHDAAVRHPLKTLFPELAVGKQPWHVHQRQAVFDQHDQRCGHHVGEVWCFTQTLRPGPSEGFQH